MRFLLKILGRLTLLGVALNLVWMAVLSVQISRAELPRADIAVDAAVVFFDRFGETARLDRAVALYKTDAVGALIIVGGCRPNLGRHGAAELAEVAMEAGVPRDSVHIGAGSFDTTGNLQSAARIARAKSWRSLTLVSDRAHLVRIKDDAPALFDADTKLTYAPAMQAKSLRYPVRLQHEIMQRVASVLLPKSTYRAAVKRLRLGSKVAPSTLCDGT